MSNDSGVEKSQLNLFDIFCLGFGGAVGSGIFVLTGNAIEKTGRSIVPVVFIGCIFMMLAYFYNILLSSMFKFTGGDYSQKAVAFNPLFTGISAYITFINGFAVAMYSIAMVDYASIVLPDLLLYKKLIAAAIITLFFAATIKGSKFVSVLNSIMTIVLIGAIAVFIVVGLPKVQPGFWDGDSFLLNGPSGFISAIAIMGWACQGTTMAPVSVNAVTKDSKRTIPLGILLVTVALAIVYALMTYVASGVLPVEQVAGQNLSVVARELFPHSVFVVFIMGGAVFAIATSMLGGIAMVRYPMMRVADDGWMPKSFNRKTKDGYPYVMYGIYYLMSILPVMMGFSLDVIVSMTMIPSMIMNFYLNLACIGIVKKYPEQYKKSILRIPAQIMNVICVLSAICAAVVLYNLFVMLQPSEMIIMVGILVAITVASYFCLKTGRVKVEDLEANKKAILEEAMSFERA